MFSGNFQLILCNIWGDFAINILSISIRAGKTEKHVGRLLLLFPLFHELTRNLTRLVDMHKMFIAKSLKLLHQMRWNFAENIFESYILILCKLELDSKNFVAQLFDPKLKRSIARRKKFKNSRSRLQKIWRHRIWFKFARIV